MGTTAFLVSFFNDLSNLGPISSPATPLLFLLGKLSNYYFINRTTKNPTGEPWP
jgi:hypothetical protein